MRLDDDICWRALRSRDRRFDGLFFIGVRTGVYCRPICPALGPKRENVRFYASAAAAEAAGFRACRRCRPEAAPGTPAWTGSPTTVARALRLISEGPLAPQPAEALAARLGVGDRHLRRLFARHLGTSPRAVTRTRRTHFARRLIDDTELPMSQVAHAAGFGSVRQFNNAIRACFGRSPTRLRHDARGRRGQAQDGEIALELAYRPPLDWDALLAFLRDRAVPGVEHVEGGAYRRSIRVDGSVGTLCVEPDPDGVRARLRVRITDTGALARVAEGARHIFDLDAHPLRIASDLARDPALAARIEARPGIRVPGAWDPFELAVRAVLGQQVTVKGATTLAGRLVRAFGKPLDCAAGPLTHLFPEAEVLADADVASIGIPGARAETLRALARAVASGKLALVGVVRPDELMAALEQIPGVGAWTAQYIALRGLGEPDAFPAGDLGLRKALAASGARPLSAAALARRAEEWRPWRAYAALWLWTTPTGESRTRRRKKQ